MTLIPLQFTLSGPDPEAIVRALDERRLTPRGTPERVHVDDQPVAVSEDWLARGLAGAKHAVYAGYPGYPHRITVHRAGLVYVGLPEVEVEPGAFAEILAGVPFELASFATIHDDWSDDYAAPSFGEGHAPLGWGAAFRGPGHERLVSRRWLDFGPWRRIHASSDVTLIQFHDLRAAAGAALSQAQPGHERMAGVPRGGFLEGVITRDLRGLYEPDERKMKVVVHGREVDEREMFEWCLARRRQAFGEERPVDAVAFVFPEEGPARRHLHELWLREHECWTFAAGDEVRIDDRYAPSPSPPGWVEALAGSAPPPRAS